MASSVKPDTSGLTSVSTPIVTPSRRSGSTRREPIRSHRCEGSDGEGGLEGEVGHDHGGVEGDGQGHRMIVAEAGAEVVDRLGQRSAHLHGPHRTVVDLTHPGQADGGVVDGDVADRGVERLVGVGVQHGGESPGHDRVELGQLGDLGGGGDGVVEAPHQRQRQRTVVGAEVRHRDDHGDELPAALSGPEDASPAVAARSRVDGEALAMGAVQGAEVLGDELLELAAHQLAVVVAEQAVEGVVGGDDATLAIADHDGLGHGSERLGGRRVGPGCSSLSASGMSLARPRHGSSRTAPGRRF